MSRLREGGEEKQVWEAQDWDHRKRTAAMSLDCRGIERESEWLELCCFPRRSDCNTQISFRHRLYSIVRHVTVIGDQLSAGISKSDANRDSNSCWIDQKLIHLINRLPIIHTNANYITWYVVMINKAKANFVGTLKRKCYKNGLLEHVFKQYNKIRSVQIIQLYYLV